MTQWAERVDNHEVFSRIQEMDELLIELEDFENDSIDVFETLNRLRQIHETLKQLLEKMDPHLIPQAVLNNLNNHINAQINQLNQFKVNNNFNLLNNVNGQADSILIQLSNLVEPNSQEDIEMIRDSVGSFRRSISQFYRYTENDYEQLKSKFEGFQRQVSELDQEVKNQKARLDSIITQYQQQFSDAQERRGSEFLEAEQNRIDQNSQSIKSFKQESQEVIDQWREVFSQEQQEAQKDFDASVEKLEEKIKLIEDKLTTQLQSSVDQMESYRDQAEKLVFVIANTGMAGGFKKVADRAQRDLMIWQGAAVLFMIGLIGFSILPSINPSISTPPPLPERIFVSVAFGILVAFTIRQVERNQKIESENRKLELELASINPFLSELPEEDQNAIKQQLALRLFGNGAFVAPIENEVPPPSTGTSADAVHLLAKTLDTLQSVARDVVGLIR